MASKEECDRYAAELTQRFEDLVQWAKEHWPNHQFPLLDSDFAASRRELGEILGPKLDSGSDRQPGPTKDANSPPAGAAHDDPEYVETSPMPWP